MLLDTDVVQLGPGWCRLLPELPGREKITAAAEAGLAQSEAGGLTRTGGQGGKALRQPVGLQEDMPGLGRAIDAGEVKIIKQGGVGLPAFNPVRRVG